VIEFARNVLGIEGANSTEFVISELDKSKQVYSSSLYIIIYMTVYCTVYLFQLVIDMPEHTGKGMGATMRLGKQTTVFLTDDCVLKKLYGDKTEAEERHRHRYEVNPAFVPELNRRGLRFVGMGINNGPDYEQSVEALHKVNSGEKENGVLELQSKIDLLCDRGSSQERIVRMEMAEIADHPFFVGVQYHPEFLSHPLQPSPPFYGLVLAASGQLKGYLMGEKVPSPMEFLAESVVQSGKPSPAELLNNIPLV